MKALVITPMKRLYYYHLEGNRYSLLQDSGKNISGRRMLFDVDSVNRKVFIEHSKTNTLSNSGRLFEAGVTRLPIENGYHIGEYHELDNIDFFNDLERRKSLLKEYE